MLVDTHCHLDAPEFDADRAAQVLAAHAAGVSSMVVPAVAPGNFSAVRSCGTSFAGCFPAYGIHPLYLQGLDDQAIDTLRRWLQVEMCGDCPSVAIGEIGLDQFFEGADVGRQAFFFKRQLALAQEFGLPVLLHVRRAIDPVHKLVRESGVRRGIAHAFNGSFQQAEAFVKLGFKLGFGGSMTYSRASRIRELARLLPLEAIVLETDAPDIPPAWMPGGRNCPAELGRIADVLAELRSVPVERIRDVTTANAAEILPALR